MRKKFSYVQLKCDDYFVVLSFVMSAVDFYTKRYDKFHGKTINDKLRYVDSQKFSRYEFIIIDKRIGLHI